MVFRTEAYAKVNIGLKITGKRDDGYHTLSSYFLLVPFHDEITLEIKDGDGTEIEGNGSYLREGEDLMAKAVRLYREKTGLRFGTDIRIRKNIPVKAGMGGGSSDASAVLRLLNAHFGALSESEMISLSSAVGADVPFFTSRLKFALVEGTGGIIKERAFPSGYRYITLFRADPGGTETGKAYRKLDSLPLDLSPLGDISYPITRSSFPNDFEKIEGTAMYDTLKDRLREGDYLSLTGSGSVWFLLSGEKWTGKEEALIATEKLFVD